MSQWLKRFGFGLACVFEGGALLKANPRWWRYALFPILLQCILSVSFLFLVNWYAWDAFQDWMAYYGQGWWQVLLRWALQLTAFVLSCMVAGVLWVALTGILCPFFYGQLTKKVEKELGTPPDELRDLSLTEEVSEAVLVLFQLVGIQAILFLIALFPIFGSALALVLGWYANAWKLGSEVFDYPLAVRGMNRKQKQAERARFKPEVLGLGTVVIFIAAIPLLGSVLLVPCIVGAVTLFRRARYSGARRSE
jgi:uncharacterized protein involved in cysteine biosynthesis